MRWNRAGRSCLMLGLALALGSCSFLGSWFGSPPKEEPVSPDEQYLPTGGNAVDLGPDQATAIEQLQQANARILELEDRVSKLTSENERLATALRSVQGDLASARDAQSKATHSASELATESRELKTKILMLQVQIAQLEQAKILMRLAALRNSEDAATASPNAVPMSGANR